MTAPAVPTGATILTADDAVLAIVIGDHPETLEGDAEMDNLLVLMIRAEVIQVVRLMDGRLAFLPDQVKVRQLAVDLGVDLGWAD